MLWNDGTPTYTEINFEEKYDETFFDWANCIVGSRKRKEKNLILVSKAKNNNTTSYISLSLAGEYTYYTTSFMKIESQEKEELSCNNFRFIMF